MDVIARCYPEHIRMGGVTVRGRKPSSNTRRLRYGANLEMAERVFVWPIKGDITKRGIISTSTHTPVEKSFDIQAAFDADAPTHPFGGQHLREYSARVRGGGRPRPTPHDSILQKVHEFSHASIVALNPDEVEFLDRLYDGAASAGRDDGASPRNQPVSGDDRNADDDLASDILDIFHDPTLTNETERLAFVQARLGQGQFRTRLIERWGGRCPVTGCSQEQALRASHIKPWRCSTNEERRNPANGLLLTANLDALFDRFLISFNDDGTILISLRIEEACYDMLGIPGSPIRGLSREERDFLAYHRAQAGLS